MAIRKHEKLLAKKLTDLMSSTDPRRRLRLGHEIQRLSSTLEEAIVAEARDAGLTWNQIGEEYGMTKQAAQQRFKNTKG